MSEVTAVNPLSDTGVDVRTGLVKNVRSVPYFAPPSASQCSLLFFLPLLPPLSEFPVFKLANLTPPPAFLGKNRPAKRQGGAQVGR